MSDFTDYQKKDSGEEYGKSELGFDATVKAETFNPQRAAEPEQTENYQPAYTPQYQESYRPAEPQYRPAEPAPAPAPKKKGVSKAFKVLTFIFGALMLVFAFLTFTMALLYSEALDNSITWENNYNDVVAQYNELYDEYESLYNTAAQYGDPSEMAAMVDEYSEKATFMDNFVVLVSCGEGDDNTVYHKFGCEDIDMACFKAYNVDNAIYMGLEECPKCH